MVTIIHNGHDHKCHIYFNLPLLEPSESSKVSCKDFSSPWNRYDIIGEWGCQEICTAERVSSVWEYACG